MSTPRPHVNRGDYRSSTAVVVALTVTALVASACGSAPSSGRLGAAAVTASSSGITAELGSGAISPDASMALVGLLGRPEILVVDLASDRSRTVSLPDVNGAPPGVAAGMAFAPDGKTAWVTMFRPPAIVPLDVATMTFGTPVVVPVTASDGLLAARSPNPWSLAIAPNGVNAYLSEPDSNVVLPVNLRTGAVSAPWTPLPKLPLGNEGYGLDLALSSDGSSLWVADDIDQKLIELSTSNGATLRTIAVPGLLNAIAYATPTTIIANTSHGLWEISTSTGTVKPTPNTSLDEQTTFATSPGTLYAVDSDQGNLDRLNPQTAETISSKSLSHPLHPSAPATQPSPGVTFLPCGSSPAWRQLTSAFAAKYGDPVAVGGGSLLCGRYSNSPNWVWTWTGNAATGAPGAVLVYRCGSSSSCKSASSGPSTDGWFAYDLPKRGTLTTAQVGGLTPVGLPDGVIVGDLPSGSTTSVGYEFDTELARYFRGNAYVRPPVAPRPA
jgi:hypothetical protein